MEYTKRDQLIDCIEENFKDFKTSLRGMSRETLFKSARRIASVTEVYEILTTDYTWNITADGEVDFYLLFRDPLTIIADAWEKRRRESKCEFPFAMHELNNNEGLISQYPLIEGVANDILYIGDTEYVQRLNSGV